MTPSISPPSFKIIHIDLQCNKQKLLSLLHENFQEDPMSTIYNSQSLLVSKTFSDKCIFFVVNATKKPGQSLGIFLRDCDPYSEDTGLFVSRLNNNLSIQFIEEDYDNYLDEPPCDSWSIMPDNEIISLLPAKDTYNTENQATLKNSSTEDKYNNGINIKLSSNRNHCLEKSFSFSSLNELTNSSSIQPTILPFQTGDRICRVRIANSDHTIPQKLYNKNEKINIITESGVYEKERKYNLDDVVLFMSISSLLELCVLREYRIFPHPNTEIIHEKPFKITERNESVLSDSQNRRVSFHLSDSNSTSINSEPLLDSDLEENNLKYVPKTIDKDQHVHFFDIENSSLRDHLCPTTATSAPEMLTSTTSSVCTKFNETILPLSKSIQAREPQAEDSNDSGLSSENSWLPSVISTTNSSFPPDYSNSVTPSNMSAQDQYNSANQQMRSVHFAGSKGLPPQPGNSELYPHSQIPWPYQRVSLSNPRTVTFRTNQNASMSSPPSPQSQGPPKSPFWPQTFYVPRHTGPLYPSQSLSDPRMLNYRWMPPPPSAQMYSVEVADKGIQCGPERHGYNSDTELKGRHHQHYPVDLHPINKNQVSFSVSRNAPLLQRSNVSYSSGEEEGYYARTSPSRYLDQQQTMMCPNQNVFYKSVPGHIAMEEDMRNLNMRNYMPMVESDFYDNCARSDLAHYRGQNAGMEYSPPGYSYPGTMQSEYRSAVSAPSMRSHRTQSRTKEQCEPPQSQMSRIDSVEFRKIQTEQWPPVLASSAHVQRAKPNGSYTSGMLVIHVIAGIGLNSSQTVLRDLYCVLEIDSIRRARSMIRTSTEIFEWDEIFELDLDDNEWLAFLFYQWDPRNRHRLCFYGNISIKPLLERFRHSYTNSEKLSLHMEPKGVLYIELLYLKIHEVFQRFKMPPNSGALFGVPLEHVVSRDLNRLGKTDGSESRVPLIVRRCTDEVEKRGLDVVSIYRLSGAVKLKIRIREMLEEDVLSADLSADTVPDIHAITAVLRDFLRELPEPLFTNALYRMILDALQVSLPGDNYAGAKLMLNILDCLPIVNQDTILHLLDHLKRVSSRSDVNKMNNDALASSLGPVLFFPSPEEAKKLDKSLLDPKKQAQTLLYILNIWPDDVAHIKGNNYSKVKEPLNIHQNSSNTNAQKKPHPSTLNRYTKPSPSTSEPPNPRKSETTNNIGVGPSDPPRSQVSKKSRRPILSSSRRSNSLEITERDQSRGRSTTMSSANHSRLTSRSSSRDRKVVLVDESTMPYL